MVSSLKTMPHFTICRFPNLLPYEEASEFEALMEEFHDLQLLGDDAIPHRQMESFETERGDLKLDALWNYVGVK